MMHRLGVKLAKSAIETPKGLGWLAWDYVSEGMASAFSGAPVTSNPYEPHSLALALWLGGFNSAMLDINQIALRRESEDAAVSQ